ncbi:MAG: hypothetical protein ACOYU7_00755 [Bacillota bacterium]
MTIAFGLIRMGWESFKKRPWPLLGAWLMACVVPEIILQAGGAAAGALAPEPGPASVGLTVFGGVLWVVYWILYFTLMAGFTGVLLSTAGDLPVRTRDVFAKWRLGWRYFLASVLWFVASSVGFLLLIIPGIYIFYRLRLYSFFLVDRNCGTMESLRLSWAATKGRVLRMLALDLAGFLVILLGFVCLVVGAIPASLVFSLAWAYFYREAVSG